MKLNKEKYVLSEQETEKKLKELEGEVKAVNPEADFHVLIILALFEGYEEKKVVYHCTCGESFEKKIDGQYQTLRSIPLSYRHVNCPACNTRRTQAYYYHRHMIEMTGVINQFQIEPVGKMNFDLVQYRLDISLDYGEKLEMSKELCVTMQYEFRYELPSEKLKHMKTLLNNNTYRRNKNWNKVMEKQIESRKGLVISGSSSEESEQKENFALLVEKKIPELSEKICLQTLIQHEKYIRDPYVYFIKVIEYCLFFLSFDKVEQLIKAGLGKMVASAIHHPSGHGSLMEMVDAEKKKMKQKIGVNQIVLDFIRDYSYDLENTNAIKMLFEHDPGVQREDLEYLNRIRLQSRSRTKTPVIQLVRNALEVMNLIGIKTNRMVQYLKETEINQGMQQPQESFRIWIDYLRMCKDMNVLDDKFPDHLYRSHALITRSYKTHLDEKINEVYEKRKNEIKHMEWSNQQYAMVLPKKLEEVIREGKILRHCVGSYTESIATGKTTVFFLRKKESLNEPLVTVEYQDGRVRQASGFANKRPEPKEQRAINDWVNYVRKGAFKKRGGAA